MQDTVHSHMHQADMTHQAGWTHMRIAMQFPSVESRIGIQMNQSLGGRDLKRMMMRWTWTWTLLWTPEILGIPVMHMTRGTLVQGHRYLLAIHSLDVIRIRMRAGLILDLIPVPTLDLIPALTLALILVKIHAFIPRLPPCLW